MESITWTGSKGNTIELKAECKTTMIDKTADLDGDIFITGKEPFTKANLELWVDGKKVDSCWNTAFWKIIDSQGMKKVWGLAVGMSTEQAEKVEKFLQAVIEDGKDDEVQENEAKEATDKRANDVKTAQTTIDKAEKTHKNADGTLMTRAQANEWTIRYNNIHNEGGEGYVPEVITQEMYDAAKAALDAE